MWQFCHRIKLTDRRNLKDYGIKQKWLRSLYEAKLFIISKSNERFSVHCKQDGRVLCTSIPTYGNGEEAGNEDGYIVGMSTCYPKPGSIKIADGELLTFESNYSSARMHTGVMGLFYVLVAEPQPPPKSGMLFNSLTLPCKLSLPPLEFA